MRIVVAGASGLIGSALTARLTTDGHHVLRLVRRPTTSPDEIRWDPTSGTWTPPADLGPVDAGICLSGAGVGNHRWTAAYRRELRDSRVLPVHTLATALAALEPRPRVLLTASGIGAYGDTGDRVVDETSPLGNTFLAGVCHEWENAARPAADAGIRVAHLRTGLVLTRKGGAFGRMLPLFRAGLGGRLGSGRQYWSVISLHDEIAAVRHLLTADDVAGPVNLCVHQAVTNAEFTKLLAHALHRPAVLPAPAFALRVVLGGFAEDVLTGQRAVPAALTASGFTFAHPDAASAVRAALGN